MISGYTRCALAVRGHKKMSYCIWYVIFSQILKVNSSTKELEQQLLYYQQKCQDTEQQVRIQQKPAYEKFFKLG